MASVERRVTGRGVSVWDVRCRDNRGRPRSRTFKRAEDARVYAKTVEADLVRGDFLDPAKGRRKFDEFAQQWLASCGGLKPKTIVGYTSMLRNHVLREFSGMAIAKIDRSHVRQFLSQMQAAGSAPGTVRSARKVLRLVLATAVESGAIKVNPCDGVRIARSEPEEMHFLTMDELLRVADAMRRPEYGLLVRFAGLASLRAGEIGGLRIGRLDPLHRTRRGSEAVSEMAGYGLVYGPPKTYERRSVPIPPFLADELGPLLVGRGGDKDAFVFTAPSGAAVVVPLP